MLYCLLGLSELIRQKEVPPVVQMQYKCYVKCKSFTTAVFFSIAVTPLHLVSKQMYFYFVNHKQRNNSGALLCIYLLKRLLAFKKNKQPFNKNEKDAMCYATPRKNDDVSVHNIYAKSSASPDSFKPPHTVHCVMGIYSWWAHEWRTLLPAPSSSTLRAPVCNDANSQPACTVLNRKQH